VRRECGGQDSNLGTTKDETLNLAPLTRLGNLRTAVPSRVGKKRLTAGLSQETPAVDDRPILHLNSPLMYVIAEQTEQCLIQRARLLPLKNGVRS